MTATARGGLRTALPPPLPSYIEEQPPPARPRHLPFKAEGLHLGLVETDDGTEFRVAGRGDPVSTYSRSTAIAELERRLTDQERGLLAGTRYNVRDVVASSTWDRMRGWGDDVRDQEGSQMTTTRIEEVVDWLRKQLEGGPELKKVLVAQAKLHGYSEFSLSKAAAELEIVKEKVGYQGPTQWSLPLEPAEAEETPAEPEPAEPEPESTPENDEAMREEAERTIERDPAELPTALETPVIEIASYTARVGEVQTLAEELDAKVAEYTRLSGEIDELEQRFRAAARQLAA